MHTEVIEQSCTVYDVVNAALDFAAEVRGTVERKKKSVPAPAGLQTFLLYVRPGGYIPTHEVSGPITVQSILGDARIGLGEQSCELPEGAVISLPAAVAHDVFAYNESVLLVTHAPRD